jgi:DNA polymerase III epsilon subunit-like protein
MSSLLFIDLETSALGDKAAVLEIALIPVINGERKEPFVSYVKPHIGAYIDPEALKINGINPKDFDSFPELEDVVKKVIEYVDQFETVFSLAGHNAVKFDVPHFYKMFCRTMNYGNYLVRFGSNTVDTLIMAKEVFKHKREKPEKFNLGALCKYFSIELTNAHTALGDLVPTVELYERLQTMMPKLIPVVNNMTYHQKRTKYMSADYLTVNPEGDIYIHCKATKDPDAMLFVLNELWRLHIK